MTEGADEGLNERAQLLLKALIENYIPTANRWDLGPCRVIPD